jgi:hypothetical protein
MNSVHQVLLHCPTYERHKAASRTNTACLPAAQSSSPLLIDEEGLPFLKNDPLGGVEEATNAAHALPQAFITFRSICVEQFGG